MHYFLFNNLDLKHVRLCTSLARVAITAIRTSPVVVYRPWSRNIRNGSQVPFWIELIRRSRIEVPRVDYEKLSGDRVGESSECIRIRVQAGRDIQNRRFSGNGCSDIVCNADLRIGEIRLFQSTYAINILLRC